MTRTDDSQKNSVRVGSVSTSRSLLCRLKENDSKAWDSLVELYAPLVFYWCRRLNVPEQDIVDIFQDVFQSLAKNINQFHKDRPGDTFRGWMRTITRNKAYDHFRKTGRQPGAIGGTEAYKTLSQFPDVEWDDDQSDGNEIHDSLFLHSLELIREDFAKQTWEAFWQVVVEGKTPREVGEDLSMRPGTVRVAKSRVLHRLRQELGDVLD
ncbi:RNA polymerase sigma factor [Gimesia aquarii]|uniref:ECF RNA polymerase sigma factor SigE n=1 Tax=Gimesia aquarii TaxID=2527964 RepID=A0A517W0E3_9PLAN|nr:sigma-70 family RNA polymerase sigma factor [Gimesia aquarii]QDT98723.1 ECF RNA polymerase sigma factor SigE [Gimesia aquarii]